MNPPRVLVTGANGFVGRSLVQALPREGVAVTAAIRRDAEFSGGVRIARINGLGEATDWRDALEGCNAVVHLAARVHLPGDAASHRFEEYRAINVVGTLALARQASAAGVKRLIYLSSIKVNGERTPPGQPFRETDTPAPVDAYGQSKLEAEQSLLGFAASSGLEVVIVRPPLVYGPGVKANFLTMARWLARGLPLPLGAITDNRRSFVGLDNLVDLICCCLNHPAAPGQVFLAADDEDLSTADLVQRTAAALGVSARLIPVPRVVLRVGAGLFGRQADFQRLCGNLQVDITKAQRVMGWRPPISVEEGLRRAMRSLRPD